MYGDSQALSSDGNHIFSLSSNAKEALFAKSRELFMDSVSADNTTNYGTHEYNKKYSTGTNQNCSSGLLRFRSAPSSLLEKFSTDGGVDKVVKNSGKNQGLTSRFSSSRGADNNQVSHSSLNGYALNSQLPPQYPGSSSGIATQLGLVNGGYRVPSSIGMDHHGQSKLSSHLMRQNSSPAELFSHLTAQTGYATMRGVGSYRLANGASGDLSPSTRLKGPMSFSSVVPSTLGMLSRISEIENETGGTNGRDDKPGNCNRDTQFYGSGFPLGSWNNSLKFAENFSGIKREIDSDQNLFSESQRGEPATQPNILSHHLSLPKTSAEIAAMEKLLQFQDTVPCRIRAKRGCATHPRSIAERVRRTRISERMRKLQDLVPNMDKQTNTADMLDLAVDYIKDLQKQYKTLSNIRANCKCSAMQKPVEDQIV